MAFFLIEKIAVNVHKSGIVFLKIVSLIGDLFSFRPYLLSGPVGYSALVRQRKNLRERPLVTSDFRVGR